MDILALLCALFPLALIFVLLLGKNLPADIAGLFGWVGTMAVACLYFETPLWVALTASFAGVVASLPVGFAMGASGFQIAVMAETGALARVIAFIKTVAPTNKYMQVLIINCGIGILLTSFGAVTIAIFPPILMALGYSVFASIALPCLGYTGGCIYAIMGVPVLVFSAQVGLPLRESGMLFAEFLPLLLFFVSLACLWLAGKKEMLVRGFLPALAASLVSGFTALPLARLDMVTLTGMVVGGVYVLVLLGVLKIMRQPICVMDAQSAACAPLSSGVAPVENTSGVVPSTPVPPASGMSLLAALSPWLMLICLSIIVNAPILPFFKMVFSDMSMPFEIIPGKAERMRLFWQPYFWIPVATLLCAPFIGLTGKKLGAAGKMALRRASRPVLAIALFFAIASLYAYSGFSADWKAPASSGNMMGVLSAHAAAVLGKGYVAATPFLGLLGGVISGSQSSGIAMLTKLHLGVGGYLGISGVALALFSAFGSGFASAISPAKVMTAAAVIDRIGEEGAVLRSILGVTLMVVLGTSVAAVIWSLW